jgi:SAM-dependent methyltransferase
MPKTAEKARKPAGKKPAAKGKQSGGKGGAGKKGYTAATADRHELYQLSVQNVESEIDFIDAEFRRLRGRDAVRLREDFCGTGNTACEWVRRRASNLAFGLDIDQPTLDWGVEHNLKSLKPAQRERVRLINRNVLEPGDAVGMDCVLAMNFSYWLFKTRDELRSYFKAVRASLADDGVFFLDHYGGSEAMSEMVEKRAIEAGKGREFTYEWDQASYNPITGEMTCRIHFRFPDRTRMKNAFEYHWRLWTLPEIRELLAEAGFSKVTVYWEGDELDKKGEPTGEGNGEFLPSEVGTADPAYISYIAAEK